VGSRLTIQDGVIEDTEIGRHHTQGHRIKISCQTPIWHGSYHFSSLDGMFLPRFLPTYTSLYLVTKLCLVMPASQALLGEEGTSSRYPAWREDRARESFSKQSFEGRHYQAELGSEKSAS
jgi:hypothetical protein